MRRLVLLILVASALLLSAAANVNAAEQPSPVAKPNRGEVSSQQNASDQHNTQADNPPTAPQQFEPTPAQSKANASKEETGVERQLVQVESRIADFTRLLVIVGIFQALAALLSGFAAVKSASAARIALQSDRPYLLVDQVRIGIFQEDASLSDITVDNLYRTLWSAEVAMRNYGKGPAVIDDIRLRMRIVTNETFPEPRDFSQCHSRDIPKEVISSNATLIIGTDLGDASLTKEQIEAITVWNSPTSLIVYGRVRYSDVLKHIYETGFLWIMSRPERANWGEVPARMHRSRRTHNYCD